MSTKTIDHEQISSWKLNRVEKNWRKGQFMRQFVLKFDVGGIVVEKVGVE